MSDSGTYGRDDFGQGGLNDQLDSESLVNEIGLDRREIQWRKDFIGFSRADVQRLETYQDVFAANADQVAEDFYENIIDDEETVEIIGRSPKNIDQLKRTQSAYLVTLAEGEYGTDYFRDRARIGKIHDMLEMPMKHYLGQYSIYYDLILPLVGDRLVESLTDRLSDGLTDGGTSSSPGTDGGTSASPGPDGERVEPGRDLPRDAIETAVRDEVDDAIEDILSILRIINLDMQVVTDTYIHSYSQKLEDEIERNERLMADVEADVQQPVSDLQESAADVADSATEISDAAERQSEQIDEIASMVDEVVDQANRVAEEIEDLAAANEEQAAMVSEVEKSVTRLSDDRSATDGGIPMNTPRAPDEVSIPEDLPDDMPEFVVDMLSQEQLREVAAGNLDEADVL